MYCRSPLEKVDELGFKHLERLLPFSSGPRLTHEPQGSDHLCVAATLLWPPRGQLPLLRVTPIWAPLTVLGVVRMQQRDAARCLACAERANPRAPWSSEIGSDWWGTALGI